AAINSYAFLSSVSPPFFAMRTRRVAAPEPSMRNPTRVATPPEVTIITFEIAIRPSFSAIQPLICLPGFGRVCRLIMPTPSTRILPWWRSTCSTRPVLPLSLPAITFTVSSFLSLVFRLTFGAFTCRRGIFLAIFLKHLGRERNDLHELLVAQFARYRPEHARSHRLANFVDQHGCVRIETNVRSIFATRFFPHPDDYAAHHFPFFHLRLRSGFLHTRGDNVAQARAQPQVAAARQNTL